MFEVIITYRADFSDQVIDRYATKEEAQEIAQHLALNYYDRVARAWVRTVSEVKAQ